MNNKKHDDIVDAIVCGLEAGLNKSPLIKISVKLSDEDDKGMDLKNELNSRSPNIPRECLLMDPKSNPSILKNVLIGNSISHSMYGLFRQEQENIKESQEGSNMEVVDRRKKAVVSFKDIKRGQPFEYDGEVYIKMYTVLGKSNAIDLSGLGACFPDPMVVTPLKGKLVIED